MSKKKENESLCLFFSVCFSDPYAVARLGSEGQRGIRFISCHLRSRLNFSTWVRVALHSGHGVHVCLSCG